MTVAVCLKCGAMKFGAWTPCPKCQSMPESPEEQAQHLIATDHFLSADDLKIISTRIEHGEPVNFDPAQVAEIAKDLHTLKGKGPPGSKGCNWLVFAAIMLSAIFCFGIAWLIAWLSG